MTKTLDELLKESGVKTTTQNAATQPSINQQPAVQQQIAVNQQPVQQNFVQNNQQQVIMGTDDVNNIDITKFMGDSTQQSGPKLEEDFYIVQCIKVELINDKDFKTQKMIEKIKFTLNVLQNNSGQPINGITLIKKTTLSFGEKSNNYKIYKAFTGITPQGKYNVLECKDKICMIRVENKTSENGTFSVITDFYAKK